MIACGVNLWVPGYGFWWMGQDGDAKFCEDARMMFFFLPSWMIFFFRGDRKGSFCFGEVNSGVRGQLFIYIVVF